MVVPLIRNCVVCNTEFETTDKRKAYCKPSCRQEAHRLRHGLEKPDFMRTDPLKRIKGTSAKSKKQANPAYEAKVAQISQLEWNLSHLRSQREGIKIEEVKIFKKDPDLVANLSTAVMATGVVLGVMFLGYMGSKSIKDKNKSNDLQFIAFLIGLGLATFLTLQTHDGNKEKHRQHRLDRINELKAQCDNIDAEIQRTESLLTVHRAELLSISATITSEEAATYASEVSRSSEEVISTDSLNGLTFDQLIVNEGYTNLFGTPARGFAMAVSGAPGNGKSTFVAQLAHDLAEDNGPCLYVSAEEGFSQSLQSKTKDFTSKNLSFSNYKTLNSISRELRKNHYDIVVLDSIQQIGMSAIELYNLRMSYPKTSFIYILQARKDGTFKGDNRFAHDADIQINLDGYVPHKLKSRFA